jgi:WD40 repeat protein
MGTPLAARLSRFLVGCHPRRWQQRYAGELLEVLDQHHPTPRTVLNLWASAVSTHLDPAYRTERHSMIRLRRLAPWSAAVAAVLLLPAGCLGIGAWREEYGSPVPLSHGTYGVAFSPDGRIVATVNPALELWDAADRAHPKRLAYTHGPLVMPSDPAFSPDGRLLATAGGGSGILWNVTDPARLAEIAALPGPGGTGALLFSPDGRILATADNGTVALWNVADPAHATHITTLTGQAGDVTALSFSPDGHLLASASDNGTVTVWDVADPARVTHTTTPTRQAGGVSALSFSPDGHLLASASDDGTVVLRNLTGPAAPVTATLRFTIPPPQFPGMATGPDVALAFSADGHTLTTIAGNTAVTLWNVTDPSAAHRITTITGSSIGPGEVAFSPGGGTVAGAPASGDTLALWMLP